MRYTPPKRPQPYKSIALADITSQDCLRPYSKHSAVRTECPVCEMTVFLHCADCNLQITGCFDTAKARMTKEDMQEFMAQMDERRRNELIRKGLWTPERGN